MFWILVSRPGIEPATPALEGKVFFFLEGKVLSPGLPGKSQYWTKRLVSLAGPVYTIRCDSELEAAKADVLSISELCVDAPPLALSPSPLPLEWEARPSARSAYAFCALDRAGFVLNETHLHLKFPKGASLVTATWKAFCDSRGSPLFSRRRESCLASPVGESPSRFLPHDGLMALLDFTGVFWGQYLAHSFKLLDVPLATVVKTRCLSAPTGSRLSLWVRQATRSRTCIG